VKELHAEILFVVKKFDFKINITRHLRFVFFTKDDGNELTNKY